MCVFTLLWKQQQQLSVTTYSQVKRPSVHKSFTTSSTTTRRRTAKMAARDELAQNLFLGVGAGGEALVYDRRGELRR